MKEEITDLKETKKCTELVAADGPKEYSSLEDADPHDLAIDR